MTYHVDYYKTFNIFIHSNVSSNINKKYLSSRIFFFNYLLFYLILHAPKKWDITFSYRTAKTAHIFTIYRFQQLYGSANVVSNENSLQYSQ